MGLIAHWKLDDPVGQKSVVDQVGTYSGEYAAVNISHGFGSVRFNGVQYISNNDTTVGTYPFTIVAEVRFQVGQLAGTGAIVGLTTLGAINQHSLLRIDASGSYSILNRNGAGGLNRQVATTSKTYVDSKWHHVVAVCANDSSRKIYIDSVLEASDINTQALAGAVDAWSIGAKNDNGAFDFIVDLGHIREVRLYNQTLTQLEINRLFRPPTLRPRYKYGYRNLRNRYK